MGAYKLFNKWDDWKTYEKAKITLARAKDSYVDTERDLRFSVTLKLFEVRIQQERVDIAKRSVDIAEAVLGNVKSKQGLGQASESDVSSSSNDMLDARKTLVEKQVALKRGLWELNILLGDPVGTPYRISPNAVRFTSIGITAEEGFRVYLENSTDVRDRKNQIRDAELDLEAALKSSLPLPEVSFSGVQVSWSATPGTTLTSSGLTSTPTNPNLEVSASVSLTLPLIGSNGFLNGRERERKRIALESRQLDYVEGVSRAQLDISNGLENIHQQEFNIDASRKQFQQAAKLLDELFSKLSSGNVSRLELRDAIRQAREAELSLYEAQVSHLSQKRDLAKKIGLSAFPGDGVE
jgi:outer membrane protein TolC